MEDRRVRVGAPFVPPAPSAVLGAADAFCWSARNKMTTARASGRTAPAAWRGVPAPAPACEGRVMPEEHVPTYAVRIESSAQGFHAVVTRDGQLVHRSRP